MLFRELNEKLVLMSKGCDMLKSMTKVYLQPLLVDSSPDPLTSSPSPLYPDNSGNYSTTRQLDSSVSAPLYGVPRVENQIVRSTFSSVPVISQSELAHEYKELGEALSEMTEFEEEGKWKIEPPVYDAARYVAGTLLANFFPAPRIFNHGPRSVVFNWSQGTRNLYLTISADRIAALISSPERIQRRMEIAYSSRELLDPSRLLTSIRSAHLEKPIVLAVSSTASDPPELVD
jgi:hypothetical protein